MIDVDDLRYKRQIAITKRTRLTSELKKCEKSYESLVEFNKSAASCRDSFESVNEAKDMTLEDVQGIISNCVTAERYYSGMTKVLNGNGGKLVNLAYTWLLNKSKSKLASYWQRILELENEIAACTKQIDSYTQEINAIEQKLAEDGVIGG